MFCVSFLSNLLSALCAYFGLVLSHALGNVAAPLAKPEREYLADQLVRERDEVVQRGVRRTDLAAVRETAEGQDLQPRRHDVRRRLAARRRWLEIFALLPGRRRTPRQRFFPGCRRLPSLRHQAARAGV